METTNPFEQAIAQINEAYKETRKKELARAIDIAAVTEREFLRQIERAETIDPELRDTHYRLEIGPLSNRICGMERLIAAMFGISVDEVSRRVNAAARH